MPSPWKELEDVDSSSGSATILLSDSRQVTGYLRMTVLCQSLQGNIRTKALALSQRSGVPIIGGWAESAPPPEDFVNPLRGQLRVDQLRPPPPLYAAASKPQLKGICHQNKWPAITAGSKIWEQMVFCLNICFQQQFPFQDSF